MNRGKLVFAQRMQHLPLTTFRRCVTRYRGAFQAKSFSCLDQFLCMAFAQWTFRESLRDIEVCLRAQSSKLYRSRINDSGLRNPGVTRAAEKKHRTGSSALSALFLPPRAFAKYPSIRKMAGRGGGDRKLHLLSQVLSCQKRSTAPLLPIGVKSRRDHRVLGNCCGR
jgi:uncharacterized protein DUF4372